MLDLELLKVERKLKRSILTRELYVFTSKDLYFGTCRQVIWEMFIVWISVLKILVEKNNISGCIWHRSCIQMAKYSFLTKKLFIKVSMMRRSRLVVLLQGKFLCFATRRQVVCEMLIVWRTPLKKWYLRFYLTQIVHSNSKMLFFQLKDCLSKFLWRAALVKLFFLQGKVCVLKPCVGKSLARCLSFEAFRRPCRKNDNSAYIWHKPFIQMVKCSSFNQRIVYQSFYGALLTLNYFLFKEKFVFYSHASASRLRDFYRKKRSEDLVKKNYISAYIWHKPFIQTVKCSSFKQRIVYESFCAVKHRKKKQ